MVTCIIYTRLGMPRMSKTLVLIFFLNVEIYIFAACILPV